MTVRAGWRDGAGPNAGVGPAREAERERQGWGPGAAVDGRMADGGRMEDGSMGPRGGEGSGWRALEGCCVVPRF